MWSYGQDSDPDVVWLTGQEQLVPALEGGREDGEPYAWMAGCAVVEGGREDGEPYAWMAGCPVVEGGGRTENRMDGWQVAQWWSGEQVSCMTHNPGSQ